MLLEKFLIEPEKNKKGSVKTDPLNSALAGIQTPNLLIRSQMLYSIELRVRFVCGNGVNFGSANVKNKFTQQNKWFCPEYKKAIFGACLQTNLLHD